MSKNLFLLFTKIGLFTIGGGHAMIPLIEKEIVDKKWIDSDTFHEIISITESLPRVFATNIAALVGYRLKGIKGSILAALGTIIAPLIIILLIALFFNQFQENPWIDKAFKGLRPAVVALIISPLYSIAKAQKLSFKRTLLPLLALASMIFLSISPIWIILATLLIGFLYSLK